jgi:shikimate dehydrogenase
MDVAPEDLPAAVEGASVLGFRGFNLTMPHKRAMLPLLATSTNWPRSPAP